MKTVIQRTSLSLIAIVLSISIVKSQNVVSGEWFVGIDPGFGQGNALSITADGEISVSDQLATSLGTGTHLIHFRVKDDEGSWSHTQYRYFHVRRSEADMELVSGEWFIGADPGVGSGTAVTIDPATEVIDLPITASVPDVGDPFRNISLRTRDQMGNWSHTQMRPLYVRPPAGGDIVSGEWFIGNDPGFGAANAIDIGSTAPVIEEIIAQAVTNGLELGDHVLFVRVFNDRNTPSLSYAVPFTIATGTGIGGLSEYGISIGPNPTLGLLMLRANGSSAGMYLRMIDGKGRIVHEDFFSGSLDLDLSRHAQGTYHLFLIDVDGKYLVYPIVKQ